MTEAAHPDPTTPDDTLVLPAELRRPRPVAWAELVALLRELLLHWGLDPRAVAAIAIDGELAAPDITRLALTASGISLPSFEEQTAELLPEGDLDEVAGCLEELHLAGDDLRWETARFSLAAQLRGLPFHWLMRGGQLVGIRFPEQTTEAESGWLRLDAELDSLVEAIRRTIERHLRPHGGQLRKLRVRAAELGDRRYRVQVDAAGRWKAFPLSARLAVTATLDEDLTVRFTDVQASSLNPLCAVALLPVPAELREQLAQVSGVDAVVSLPVGWVDFTRGSEKYEQLTAIGFDPAVAGVVTGAPATLGDDEILVSSRSEAAKDGQRVTLSGLNGSVELTLTRSHLLSLGEVMVSQATLAKLGSVTPDALVWLSIPDRSRAISAVGQILDLTGEGQYMVTGGVIEAAQIEEVLNLLLLITTALLAVAVLIALVGVSNTLGLSVIERTRESALLRALGLQTSSLRLMLLIEALLLAGVGVLVGIGAGVFFGWLGSAALIAMTDGAEPRLAVDLPQTLGMVVVAVVAAALASVLPGRRAAQASPVEALADI